MNEKPIRVLMVEDDPDYVEIVRLCLAEPESMGLRFELESASRLAEALQKLAVARYDAVLVDLGLPDAQGLEAAQAVLSAVPDTPVLVATNFGDESTALEAMRRGAQDFMIKASSDSRWLKRSIRYAIERKAALAQRDQIIRSSADGMVVVDAGGAVRFMNGAAEAALGVKAAEALGKPFPYPAQPGESRLVEAPRPDGGKASIEIRVTAVTWDDAPASLASLRDVTELRRVEQLRSEVAERRRADEMKDKWMGTISHELRTPLSIVKGAVADLHEGLAEPLQPQQAMLVGLARRQVERIERMVISLLDLNRLESGSVRARTKPVDVCALGRRVVEDFQRAAADRALKLELEACDPPATLGADAELLEQLLVNLVENALRFARARVLVRVAAAADGAEFSVTDDGVGIPPEKRKLLFTRYSQIERRSGDGYKGTGLGLAICKEIVALHGGRIEIESEPGRGTTFRVRLPAKAPAEPAPAAARGGGDAR